MVTAAVMLTNPTAAPGASGRMRAAPANAGANGNPAASPTARRRAIASASGEARASRPVAEPADQEARAQKRGVALVGGPPSGRVMMPRKRVSAPASAGERRRVAAGALEQRHDPVPDDHREPERGAVHHRQRAAARRSARLTRERGDRRLARRLGRREPRAAAPRAGDDRRGRDERAPASCPIAGSGRARGRRPRCCPAPNTPWATAEPIVRLK